jgi:hypothetical protein
MSDDVVREVVGAVAAVLGTTAEVVMSSKGTHAPELVLVRHVAAVALAAAGWARNRIARHCRIDRKSIACTGTEPRLRANVPALIAVAEEAARIAIHRADLSRDVLAEARDQMKAAAANARIPVDVAATANTKVARSVRAIVARHLYALEYDGPSIARALGYGETAVYRMIAGVPATGRRAAC